MAKTTHTKHTDTNEEPLEPGSPSSRGRRGQGETNSHSHPPSPAPSSTPSLRQHAPPPLNAPQGRKNGEGGEGTGQGERDEQREVTAQGRPRSPKTVHSAEGGEGKDKRERITVVVRSPCQGNGPADAPAGTSQCWSRQTPARTRRVHLDAPGQRLQPRLWDGRPPE